jgi:peptide/nickel transport system substrate-binding protein
MMHMCVWRRGFHLLLALVLVSILQPLDAGAHVHQTLPGPFTIGLLGLPASLDPLISASLPAPDITDAVFDSLLRADTHDALQPDLARRYTISPDGLRYTFYLDPRAHWQDGIAVTAQDVLFTTRLMRDPHFPAFNRFGYGLIASIAADGDYTVVVTLTHTFGPFLRAFATTPILPAHVLAPIPVDQLAGYSAFNRHPLGSGPFAVTSYDDGTAITLAANPTYFRGAPLLPTLRFQVVPSAHAALQALQSGAIDMLGPSAGIPPSALLSALSVGHLNAFAAPGFGWAHIDLIESSFLRQAAVREALAYATPRQRIIATIFKGLVAPADADQPPTSIYYNPGVANSYPYDPARTAALLRAQGFTRHGASYEKAQRQLRLTLWFDQGCGDCRAVARMIAQSWTAAGIPTILHGAPTHTLFGPSGPLYSPDRLRATGMNAVLYSWVTLAEPDDSVYWKTGMIVRAGHENGLNFDGFSDPAVDQLAQRALTTANEAQRIYAYQQIQVLLVHEQPDIFLYWLPYLSVAVNTLHGYEANPFDPGLTWDVAHWRLL